MFSRLNTQHASDTCKSEVFSYVFSLRRDASNRTHRKRKLIVFYVLCCSDVSNTIRKRIVFMCFLATARRFETNGPSDSSRTHNTEVFSQVFSVRRDASKRTLREHVSLRKQKTECFQVILIEIYHSKQPPSMDSVRREYRQSSFRRGLQSFHIS